ncbi:MAG: serine/threonine-protein kinase, partial [Planctomycetota bacterium]|nr:serine/threonine-protein kinase [Planctomycetota bacterium]
MFDSSSSIAGEQSSAVIGETSTEHRIVTFQFDRGIISLNGIERLRRIADDLREIEAPQILDIQTVDILDDGCRVVMSPVSGSTLEQLLKTRQPSWLESLQLMTEVVKALVPVHERGMGHGCLKPSRIFLRDLQLTNIVDFGLSLVSGELSNSHDCDAFVCAAPENVQSQRFPLTPQMDVYGVGVLLYRLICGRFPFRADNQSELLRQIQEDPVQPPRQLAPDIPRELEQLCLSCLAKHPADRPPSARELWKSLNRLLVSHQKSTLESSSDSLSQSAVRRLGGQRPATIRRVMLLETEPKDGVLLAVFSTLLERLGIYPEPWSGDGLLFPLPETGSQSDWSVPFADRVLRCLRAAVKEQQSRDASLSENGTVFSIRVSSARLSIRPDRDQPVEPELLERRLVQLEAKIENGNVEVCNRGHEFLIRGLYCDESKIVSDSPSIGIYRIADRDGAKLTVRASQVRNQLPLSGRDPQFQMLKSRWEQACEGMGQV